MVRSTIPAAMLLLGFLLLLSHSSNGKQAIKVPKIPRPSKMDTPIRIPRNEKGGSLQTSGFNKGGTPEIDPYTKLGMTLSPGNMFLFWHVLVPATVLLHFLHYGIRGHEFVTLLALLLNPVLVKYIVQNAFLSSVSVLFLLMAVGQMMTRWALHKIFTLKFLISLLLLIAFLALPDLFQLTIWRYAHAGVYNVMRWFLASSSRENLLIYTDTIMLMVAVLMLLHAIHFYRCYGHCPGPVRKQGASCPSNNCDCCLRSRISALYRRLICCCEN